MNSNNSERLKHMIKAIFLDYTGTMVNDEEYTKKMLGYFMKYIPFGEIPGFTPLSFPM